jgi:hypothetical protein
MLLLHPAPPFPLQLAEKMMRMISFRAFVTSGLIAAAVCAAPLACAQAGLQQKLEAQYTLTKPTADRSDIVTAGSVLLLHQDGLLMYVTTASVPPLNTFKDGKISSGVFQAAKGCKFCGHIPGIGSLAASAPTVQNRTFVSGEKFWVTKIDVEDDGVVFSLFSDPISDVRYYSLLKFPFPKGSPPDADHMLKTVGEVLTVQQDDSGGDNKQSAAAGSGSSGSAPAGTSSASSGAAPPPAAPPQSAPATEKVLAPIAPPPPPSDAPPPQPKTIAIGQTKDMVVANFGQPTKVVKLAKKEIDYYPDMKVTFVDNKVTDVQ